MGSFLEQMVKLPVSIMKLPVDVMASSMETYTKTMSNIPKSPAKGKGADSGETDIIEQMAKLPVSMMVLPASILFSSIGTMAKTMQEIRDGPAKEDGTDKRKTTGMDDTGIVQLTAHESELEKAAVLTVGREETFKKTLWQIGRAGRCDYQGEWKAVFDYHVGSDIDAINRPAIPHFLTAHDGLKFKGATERINIHFALERNYSNNELAFFYDRWGGEKDEVFIDGELLTPISGKGRGKFKQVALLLNGLSHGEHVISITTSGEKDAGEHRIDCLKLVAIEKSAEPEKQKETIDQPSNLLANPGFRAA